MFIHPRLLKAARQVLDISQNDLAKAAGISERSIRKLESFDSDTTVRTIEAVQRALEDCGVIFLGEDPLFGSGFRLPPGYFRKTKDGN
uniref:Putative transcriptional regulator, XRE family n=1 Tax=Rhodopseudomonas palustris (strain BisA53) TaxID=316055 RepID=Q07NQ9_RHOP5